MTKAYLALGANLGDRRRNIESALDLLRQTKWVCVVKISPLVETQAVGGPEGSPPFLNAAAEIETDLSPAELLDRLLSIEQRLGRQRREKWGPRLIDLDLLLFGGQIIDQPGLQVPHPLMHRRRFVLEPLAAIAPEARHPVAGKTILELLADVPPAGFGPG